jgi:hypothetical protein
MACIDGAVSSSVVPISPTARSTSTRDVSPVDRLHHWAFGDGTPVPPI